MTGPMTTGGNKLFQLLGNALGIAGAGTKQNHNLAHGTLLPVIDRTFLK